MSKENFNLNDASEKMEMKTGPTYQRPGIAEGVRISKVTLEKTSTNQVDYLQLETIGLNGEVGKSNRMFLSTDVKEGKKMAAWAVTARNLTDILMVTHNVDEATAKSMINVGSKQELASKLSSLVIGRPFRAKFKGVETAKGAIIAELAGVESMNVSTENTRLRYNADRDVTKYQGTTQAIITSKRDNDDLPF